MKTRYIFVLALLAFLTVNVRAAEKVEDIDFDDKPPVMKQLTEEQIDEILEKITVDDPNEAKQLEKMRKENPDMFIKQLHKRMMQNLRQQRGMGGPDGRMPQGDRGPQMGEGPGDGNGFRGERFAQMEKKKEEYLKWLQENYPDEFTRLEELKEKEPELYFRQMMVSGKKYGKIFELSQSDPELAKILKEDLTLKQKRDELIKQIATAKDEEKAKLTKDLEVIVGQRFDLILKRKQLAYDQLRERLEKLKEEVQTSQDEVEKWKETKDVKVKERVEDLLKRSETFNWEE